MDIIAYGDMSIVDSQENEEMSNYELGCRRDCNDGCPYCACDDWDCDDHCAD